VSILYSLRSAFSIFIILLFGSQLGGCGGADDQAKQTKPAPIRPVKTILVKPTISKFQRTYYAVVLPSQEVELSFRVPGRLIKFPIRNVKKTNKGDIIAQLETREFTNKIAQMASQIEQAKAQLHVLTAGARKEDIAALQAGVAAAQAQVTSAEQQMERSRKLEEKGIVTRATLDKDRTSLRVANAELVAKKQELIKGQKGARKEDVEAQDAVIRGLASQMNALKDDLSDTTLRAPFDGVIAVRKVENFSNIQAKEAIATFQSLATPNMSFDIPAPDIPKLAKLPKLDMKVILDGFPGHEFIAKRREFSTQADAATQTYRGRVAIVNANGEPILPGMTGNLIVTASQQGASVFKLPVSAIASEPDGKPFVWVVNPPDNKVGKRSITTGEASGADVLISSGLKEGDIIISAGLSALQENMIVKPVSSIGE
jgi:membrane fusion protein, multidrug efflux system